MDNFLSRYSEYAYALLRIVTGFLFLWHGSQKLLGYPPTQMPAGGAAPQGLSPLMAVGGTIELVAGILILVGFLAAIAAFIACGEMAVAYFMVHFSVQKFLPLVNGGELAVLYCFVFLYIASRGSGVWSVDNLRRAGPKPV